MNIDRGILAKCAVAGLFGERVFFLYRGRRHWVPSGDWITAQGLRFPEDVAIISEKMLLSYLPGQVTPVANRCKNAVLKTVFEARATAAAEVRGVGLEIGAYANPFPVPLDCIVQYGDMYTYDELLAEAYKGQALHDIVMPSINTDLDTLRNVPDESLDFLVACHVIEHTRDPIGVIKRAYSKLRKGGSLVLTIPDKERTFDKPRRLTTLDHLIEDYSNPSRERDKEHFQEFYSKTTDFAVTEVDFEKTWRAKWATAYPIHYHTWVYGSFTAMVDWTVCNVVPFRSVWSHPTVSEGNEFYFTLLK